MQYVLFVIGLVLGAVLGTVLGTWFGLYIRRPTLRLTGGGSSPAYVTVTNHPGLFGLSLNETVVFGKHLHGRIEKGLTVERNPATDCTAFIHDKKTTESISGLYWRTKSGEFTNHLTIASGESASLMLFARSDDAPGQYFVYAPESDTSPKPRVPAVTFDDTREFVVRIRYSFGRHEMKFDATVRKSLDGRLECYTKTGGGSF